MAPPGCSVPREGPKCQTCAFCIFLPFNRLSKIFILIHTKILILFQKRLLPEGLNWCQDILHLAEISKSERKAIIAYGLCCKFWIKIPFFLACPFSFFVFVFVFSFVGIFYLKNALGTANQFANGLNRSLGRAHINGLWKVNSREWNICFWQPQQPLTTESR